MRYSLLVSLFGRLALSFAVLMLPVVVLASFAGGAEAAAPFTISMLLLTAGGGGMLLAGRGAAITLSRADLCFAAIAAWCGASCAAALPFAFTPGFSWMDAWFEGVSWLTTTGALAQGPWQTSPSLILWRAELQWVGGFAAILTAFLILMPMGVGGMGLQARIFAPAPDARSFARQFRQILRLALPPYLLLTLICLLCLLATGAELHQAVLFSLSALATGNLNPAGDPGLAYSLAQQMILSLFLITGALGLVFQRSLFSLSFADFWRDAESRAFIILVLLTTGFFFLAHLPVSDAGQLLAKGVGAVFAAVSLLSTSASLPAGQMADVSLYTALALPLVLTGGATLSTAGGLKILRLLLLAFYQGRRELAYILDPNSMVPISLPSGAPVKIAFAETVWALFLLAILSLSILSAGLAFAGMDFPASLAAAAAVLANAGPALAIIDPTAPDWGALEPAAKFLLTLGMIVGRTEFILAAGLFAPSVWNYQE